MKEIKIHYHLKFDCFMEFYAFQYIFVDRKDKK